MEARRTRCTSDAKSDSGAANSAGRLSPNMKAFFYSSITHSVHLMTGLALVWLLSSGQLPRLKIDTITIGHHKFGSNTTLYNGLGWLGLGFIWLFGFVGSHRFGRLIPKIVGYVHRSLEFIYGIHQIQEQPFQFGDFEDLADFDTDADFGLSVRRAPKPKARVTRSASRARRSGSRARR